MLDTMHKTELFDEVIGGGTLSSDDVRSDLTVPRNLAGKNELDKQVARLFALNPRLQSKFRNNNLDIMDESAKRVLLEHMRDFLGISR